MLCYIIQGVLIIMIQALIHRLALFDAVKLTLSTKISKPFKIITQAFQLKSTSNSRFITRLRSIHI